MRLLTDLRVPLWLTGQVLSYGSGLSEAVRDEGIGIYLCHIHRGGQMSITSVFTNNRSQAVRLPAELRLPEGVKKVRVRARGLDRIISPVGHSWDEFFLNGPVASEDFMAERAAQHQSGREPL